MAQPGRERMGTANSTVAQDVNALDTISNGMVALIWRCLDGFDRWYTRRAAIRQLYSVNGRTLSDIGVNRTEINSAAYGNATMRRRIYAKH